MEKVEYKVFKSVLDLCQSVSRCVPTELEQHAAVLHNQIPTDRVLLFKVLFQEEILHRLASNIELVHMLIVRHIQNLHHANVISDKVVGNAPIIRENADCCRAAHSVCVVSVLLGVINPFFKM